MYAQARPTPSWWRASQPIGILAVLVAWLPLSFGSEPDACADLPVEIVSEESDDAHLACQGARAALGFMRSSGMEARDRIRIVLVRKLPSGMRADTAGYYALNTQRVVVLNLREFMVYRTWFGVPASAQLYRSVVAHEVAHAIIDTHLDSRRLPAAAHEYLAYITMFASMEPTLRQQALAAWPGNGFRRHADINDLRYAFDPERFGVDSYRHWLAQEDGAALLQRVVAGEIVPDLGLIVPDLYAPVRR